MHNKRQRKEFLKNILGENLVSEDSSPASHNFDFPSDRILKEFSKFLGEIKSVPPFKDGLFIPNTNRFNKF